MLIWNQQKEGNPAVGHERLGGFPFLFLFWWTLLPRLDNHTTASLPCPFPPRGAWIRASFLLFVRCSVCCFSPRVSHFATPLSSLSTGLRMASWRESNRGLTADWPFRPPSSERVCLFVIPFANTWKIGWFWAESMTFYVKMRDFLFVFGGTITNNCWFIFDNRKDHRHVRQGQGWLQRECTTSTFNEERPRNCRSS